NIKSFLVPLVLLAAVVSAINYGSIEEVRADTAGKRDISELIVLQGKVELDKNEKVYARLDGFVDETNVSEGDEVKEGTKLLQLSVEDIDFAVKSAEAAYKGAEAQLESLKQSIKPEHIRLAEAELEKAKAALKAAASDYDNIKYNFENIKSLYISGAVSEKDMKDAGTSLDASESGLKNAEQTLRMAEYNLQLLTEGVSREDIKAAEANARMAGVQLEELLNSKGKTNIVSHISGTVLSKEVEKEQAVTSGTLLYEIGDYDTAYIRVDALVDDIAHIRKGQKALISGDVLSDAEIEGRVYYIAPKAEASVSSLGIEQQRIEVRISFDNKSLRLKPGYTMDVDIATREKKEALCIPDKALFEFDGKDTVFIARNNRLELRAIKTGLENEDFVEVVSGVSEGDIVVVDPDSKLEEGQKIKFKK
ncbi:MAG: efflux RND transporter periplasmic adaptor subunit, partial [Pseudomonadota bacterium]